MRPNSFRGLTLLVQLLAAFVLFIQPLSAQVHNLAERNARQV